MAVEYSVETCKALEQSFKEMQLHRPMRTDHYDNGDTLTYNMTSVSGKESARVHLEVKTFVGGGFAGQVYKVQITDIEGGDLSALDVGAVFAMKILVPPSKGSLMFRNVMYAVGFQAPFQLQTNPAAARSGALWQKFIRRAARIRFGDESVVNDIHATFVDENLGSCGEISDWVDGRTWQLEVDEHLDALKLWKKGGAVESSKLGSPEYRSKYIFMHDFVDLLHDMGAHEFARQYEWSTCKSQPNCLKRLSTEKEPEKGLMAVDFRAGLTLLPFLPMSPGDFKLIGQGLKRGSLVQFDRGNLKKLESFINEHSSDFDDMRELLPELRRCEEIYRNSIPDITHNHFRLLFSGKLWSTIMSSAVEGWRIRNMIDDAWKSRLMSSKLLAFLFMLLGIIPILGRVIRKTWARPDWRRHYASILTKPSYFLKALKGKLIEKVISWHREGRMDKEKAMKVAASPSGYALHVPLSLLPAGLHKALTDFSYLKERLDYLLARPVRLYFNSQLREEWLREMVADGEEKRIISPKDRDIILSQINEPFIQKYLKSLAVHVCTVPITQVVSVTVAITYILMHPEMPRSQAWAIGLGIIALFQVVPISPGSLVRGLYVLFLVIRERNFKDYNIAVFLGFFKYIGYLAFPIQMAYRYPVLARFMAGYWATEAVHVVPVFGERGALLERWVFCLFYNWPLTIGRRVRSRFERRKSLTPRYWHAGLLTLFASAGFSGVEYFHMFRTGAYPDLRTIWWAVITIPLLSGSIVTLGCGGATLWKRIQTALSFGALFAILQASISNYLRFGETLDPAFLVTGGVWRLFLFSLMAILGLIFTELMLPDPEIRQKK